MESVLTYLKSGLQDKAVDSSAGALYTDLSLPWGKPKLAWMKVSDHFIRGENPDRKWNIRDTETNGFGKMYLSSGQY